MKRNVLFTVLLLLVMAATQTAWADAVLSFSPLNQTVPLNSLVSVAITADPQDANKVVGNYNFTVTWDPNILTFNGFTFSGALGSEVDGSTVNLGSVDVFNVSLELDPSVLAANQLTRPIDLFTLTFLAANVGHSDLNFVGTNNTPIILGDFDGTPYSLILDTGGITVTQGAIPEPTTMLLVASGFGAALLRRRKK